MYAFPVKRNVGGGYIRPAAAIIVVNAPSSFVHGFVSMAAKNIIRPAQSGIKNGASGDFLREAQPTPAFSLQKVADSFILEVKELNEIVYLARQNAEESVVYEKIVKLMAMDSQIFLFIVLPFINFVKTRSRQRGKNFREPLIVVSLHPAHFCRLGQLADDRNQFSIVIT